jgi:hypothetical protein
VAVDQVTRERWAHTSAAPLTPTPPARPVPAPHRPAVLPDTPDSPPWTHRFLPKQLRNLMADLGWWNNPAPQRPSTHLMQVLAVLEKYGWAQSLDVTVRGRMCIRGAQNLLEKTGHVTPVSRERAVAYMQQALAQQGVVMQFFAWNDLPDQQFPDVQNLIVTASRMARANGE